MLIIKANNLAQPHKRAKETPSLFAAVMSVVSYNTVLRHVGLYFAEFFFNFAVLRKMRISV